MRASVSAQHILHPSEVAFSSALEEVENFLVDFQVHGLNF
jgi:hypothetical protein